MVYTRKAIATRGRILDSAAELMFAKGFAQTKLLEVLNSANVQKGNFYYYFGSKEELGLAVIQERGAKVIKEWLDSIIDPAGKPWNNIEALAHGIVGLNSRPPDEGELIQILAHERLEAGSELRQAIAEVLGNVIKTFSREFSRMQHSGQLSGGLEPELYGAYLFSLLEGALLVNQYRRDQEMLKNTVEMGLRSIRDAATRTAT
jgi:TetR/AcrR family transcriptional repressor of nem operon